MCSFSEKLKKNDGTYHFMHTVITGEKTLRTENGEWKVDGYCDTGSEKLVYEFYGCR